MRIASAPRVKHGGKTEGRPIAMARRRSAEAECEAEIKTEESTMSWTRAARNWLKRLIVPRSATETKVIRPVRGWIVANDMESSALSSATHHKSGVRTS